MDGNQHTIPKRLRTAFTAASPPTPLTLTELQVNCGMLLKPGTLILRVLLELLKAGHNPELTRGECQAFLIPCKTNQEWHIALDEILTSRANSATEINWINQHSRRNIQDWFKFLDKSDFFTSDGHRSIKLSAYALGNPNWALSLCNHEEDAGSFWIPSSFGIPGRRSWFDWFGHLPYSAQSVFRSDVANDQAYLAANYVGGIDEEDGESNFPETAEVNLQPLNLAYLGRDSAFSFAGDISALAENLRRGAQKRHAKTLLHDRIIKDLAEYFSAQGATVESDPNSIDLFSTWPDGHSAIFEVKTVTRRSLQERLRTAIGQVEEYAYRRTLAGAGLSDRVVVINAELESASWQRTFLTDHLNIGLICKTTRAYKAYAPTSSLTHARWEM